LTRRRAGCSIFSSEDFGVFVAGSRSLCSSSAQHLGYGARTMIFPFDENTAQHGAAGERAS
jgi:hypothetical protein